VVLKALRLGPREQLVLRLVNGQRSFKEVTDGASLPLHDAVHALCELLEGRVIAVL
jgi:hypothetical protein